MTDKISRGDLTELCCRLKDDNGDASVVDAVFPHLSRHLAFICRRHVGEGPVDETIVDVPRTFVDDVGGKVRGTRADAGVGESSIFDVAFNFLGDPKNSCGEEVESVV